MDKSQPIAKYLINKCGLGAPNSYSVVEQDQFIDSNIVISVPVNHEHGILRSQEKAVDLLKRVKHVHKNWIQPTHRSGPNTHNVSVTVSYRPEEIDEVTDWMVENRDSYCGIALLPYDPTTYPQAPFEETSKSQFETFEKQFRELSLDLSEVDFSGSIDERKQELACSGGVCEFK